MSDIYNFQDIEPKWQRYWADNHTFRAANPGRPGSDRPPFYVLDFFPYPSGAGLHVGHPLGYIATDIIARHMRMQGYNVLHPMGWDAFGLPAEQYAIETGVHPAETTRKNIETYKRQLTILGLSYDWERELATCTPDYYKWTQWIFLQIYNSWYDPEAEWTDSAGRTVLGRARPIDKLPIPPEIKAQGEAAVDAYQDEHRLAFAAEVPVNWCPALGTVLANEEVTADGRSERGNHPVYRRPMRQWMLRITEYAERLLDDLEHLDWPESVKLMQRNWIGRSAGAYVDFQLERDPSNAIRVFTTRPDTLFGATYLVLAPEHWLVGVITTPEQREGVERYVEQAKQKSELDRAADTRVKTGVFTGAYAINPVNHERVPIWVADYVIMGYGTGSIMAVPGHDQRDYEFAKAFDLTIRDVIHPLPVAAIAYFVEHASAAVLESEHWNCALAAFLAALDPQQTTPQQFAALLQGTLAGQAQDPTRADELLADAWIKQLPPRVEEELGNTKVAWSRVFALLGWDDPAVLRDLFRKAKFYAATGAAYTDDGYNVNSPGRETFAGQSNLNGLPTPDAKRTITTWLEERDLGEGTVQFKLRDWLFSRQRYWGEPFPILARPDGRTLGVDESELPVTLPEMTDFRPTASDDPHAEPQTPLSRATDWVRIERDGETLMRELNTMPQWAGSCWYYLRFLDPWNEARFVAPEAEEYWMSGRDAGKAKFGGVDLYLGGAEHAVLHLLYARFWHKVLYDLGHVSTPEPFQKLFNQGMIGATAYHDERGSYVPSAEVTEGAPTDFTYRGELDPQELERLLASGLTRAEAEDRARKTIQTTFYHNDRPVAAKYEKMSKSKKNVVNPDEIIAEKGADTLRLYEMSMGPLDAAKPWNTDAINGSFKFLNRVWRLVVAPEDENQAEGGPWRLNPRLGDERDADVEKLLHKTIKKVEEDINRFALNTAIAQMHVWVKAATGADKLGRDQVERFLLVLAPFAPHLCEELWERLGHAESIAQVAWPKYDPALCVDDEVEIAVQVRGKVRGRITVPADADDDAIVAAAKRDEKVAAALGDKEIKRAIVVPKRLVNLII